jgi:hypothetical protein
MLVYWYRDFRYNTKESKNTLKTSIYGNDTNRIKYVKERFFHSFKLFDRVEMSERQTKTERRKKL